MKAVSYGEGMLVIEKVQLYQESVSISTLRLSESKVAPSRTWPFIHHHRKLFS